MILLPSGPRNVRLTDAEMGAILGTVPAGMVTEDAFFGDQRFFPGIIRRQAGGASEPHEYLAEYERLLDQLRRVDPGRFATMHKGTPYYIMGWLAYSMKDYERGVFYMDSALSEDVANNPNWQTTPAAAFIFLDPTHPRAAANEIVTLMHGGNLLQQANSKMPGWIGSSVLTDTLLGTIWGSRRLNQRTTSI